MVKDLMDRRQALKNEAAQRESSNSGKDPAKDASQVRGMKTEALEAMWRHPGLGERGNRTLKGAVLSELSRRKGPDWTRAQVRAGGPGAAIGSDEAAGVSEELAPVYAQLAESPELFLEARGGVAALHEADKAAGKLEDCHFVAALAALEMRDPAAIQQMVKPLGGGEYEVTFTDGTVVVDDQFTFESAEAVYAGKGDRTGDERERNAMLLEKAWDKLKGGYEVINGQKVQISSVDAMEALSGRASKVLTTDSISESDLLALLAAADGKGLAVMAASRGRKDFNEGELDAMGSSGVDCNQAYVVVGVTQTARTVDLHNPRASGQVAPNMEIAEFQRWFGKVRISPAS